MTEPTVLHVTPSLRGGGAEHMLARLVQFKRRQSVSAIIAHIASGGELAEQIRTADVPIHEFGLSHPAATPIAILRLARLIRQVRPVAIQGWMYYGDLLSLWALEWSGLRNRTRLYWGVRGSDLDLSHYRRSLGWTISACARCSERPDAVVANSFAGQAAHRQLGYSPKAFPVIPNGIDTELFRPDPSQRASTRAQLGLADDQLTVVHAARMDPMKDHDSLLAVARALPTVRFLAVGSGTEALDAPANVLTLGYRRDMHALYAASDLALSTSAFGEGFPNVVAEAMAHGLPVVATDVGDARHIVGDTGLIVAPSNVTAMSTATLRLLTESEGERHVRGEAGRQRIERHFSLARAVAAFDALHLRGTLPDNDPIRMARLGN
jgi:glycosyltransferase involved in cell wall biosynthesis